MYLKRIEMQGFKSFADKTILELKNGITAVIGPNGSGKSNISDAIRWVLGEQKIKSLRGVKAEDIIFAGTETRKALGFAEVSIILDNTDEILPIEFNEVVITRRIYRTGESGYFINKTECRLKDILELFMDTGLGKDGYSIIGQGRIDEILSDKAEDRRHIFEEAAGIVKYRVRREESEKKLEKTKINLIRINDILSEIENNLEPLQIQSEKAKEFIELKDKLKKIEIGLFNYKILEYKNKIEKLNSMISINNEKIINNQENNAKSEIEINRINNKILRLKEEQKDKRDRKAEIDRNKEKIERKLKEKEKELNEFNKKKNKNAEGIESNQNKKQELINGKIEIQNELIKIATNLSNLEERKNRINDYEKLLRKEIEEKDIYKKEFQENFVKTQKIQQDSSKKINRITKSLDEIEKVINKYNKEINEITDEKRMKISKCNFLIETEKEKAGFIKSVKEILISCEKNKELTKGVNGVLANLIDTEDKYFTAIELALGSSLQNIVTDTEEEAKKMIEYLKNNNLGRASFLPINVIKGSKLNLIINDQGVIGIASDLIKCDEKYKNIVLNLLGRTVIVENIETGIKIAKKNKYTFRIVTLGGDIINPSGAITGGSITKKNNNLIGRKKEIQKLEKEIIDLDKKLEKIVFEKDEKLKEKEIKILELKQEEKYNQENKIDLAKEKEKKNNLDLEILKLKEKQEENLELLKNVKKEIEEKEKQEKEYRNKIFEKNEKIKQIEEIIKSLEYNKQEMNFLENMNNDILDFKISISAFDESKNSVNEILEKIENEILEEIKNKENFEKLKEVNQTQNEKFLLEIENYKLEIKEIQSLISEDEEKIIKQKTVKQDMNSKIDIIEKDIENQFEILQNLESKLVKINLKQEDVEKEKENNINQLWNEYELTPNNLGEFTEVIDIKKTENTVQQIHLQIREMGSVNLGAIEEYKNVKERYETMSNQRLDLENTIYKLRKIINEMTEKMKIQFKEQFKIINQNFNEVFKELFGGGKAELILEDEENILESGISIQVQPIGKKLQNMLLLSGGERALTAIALLFAILKMNPAPFCILDEIEAALDDANIEKYAEYLKKFSNEIQFLIITHRKGSMEVANILYGVTMEENGISKILSINLGENKE